MPVASGLPRIREDLAAYGVVTQVISATSFVAAGLAGFGDGAFQSYAIYVLKKANNTTTPPHREQPACATYVSNSGTFTHVAFTAALAVGDEILLLHPNISTIVAGWALNNQGLCYYGVVTAVPGANQFTIPTLAGLGAGKFDGVNNPYFAFVFRDAFGAAAAPQGEQQPITGYVTATGTFTSAAFTAAVAVGDEILIVSPYLAAMSMLWAGHSGALAHLGQCAVGMAPSTNVMNCPNLAFFPDQTFTRGYQMIVLRNASAVANPPEMEMRAITNFAGGFFATAAFSANVEENDIVLVIHNSVAAQISAYGIADAGSGVGIVRDAARTEADDWWNGQTVMMLSGAARGQKRPIADFIAATDDIIPAPNFDAAVAAGDLYIILAHYNPIVPRTADAAANYLTSDVVGRKDDTAIAVADNTSSLMRYTKAILAAAGPSGLNQGLVYYGVVTAIPGANQFTIPTLAGLGAGKFGPAAGRSYWAFVLRDAFGAGAAPQHEVQNITVYDSPTGTFTTTAYTAAVAPGDEILILHPYIYALPDIQYLTGGLIWPQVAKSLGAAPVVGNTVANWFAAEADIVSIGADNIRNKLHSLELDITGAVGTITIRLYKQIDGVERRVYQQTFTVAADGPGLWIVNGTVGIHEVLRVTAQSSLVGDNGLAIHYDYMLEAM